MRISDLSSDVCSSDLGVPASCRFDENSPDNRTVRRDPEASVNPFGVNRPKGGDFPEERKHRRLLRELPHGYRSCFFEPAGKCHAHRSEEHTSELRSLMRISYAVFCFKKKINNNHVHSSIA